MKKILLTFVMCAVAVLCFPLTACEQALPHEHTYSSAWTADNTDHWHICTGDGCNAIDAKEAHTWDAGEITVPATAYNDGVKTYICTVCGTTKTEPVAWIPPAVNENTNPDDIVSEKITSDQWKTAFSDEKLSNVAIKVSFWDDAEFDYRYVQYDGDACSTSLKYYTNGVLVEEIPVIWTKEKGKYYIYEYNQENAEWTRSADADETIDKNGFRPLLVACGPTYDSFSYDEEANAYVAYDYEMVDDGELWTVSKVLLKFCHSELSYVEITEEETDFSSGVKLLLYDYGTTVVELPAIQPEPDDIISDRITSDQWKTAFSAEQFVNCTIKTLYEGVDFHEDPYPEPPYTTMCCDGDSLYMKSLTFRRDGISVNGGPFIVGEWQREIDEYYAAREGGAYYWYEYSETERRWIRTVSDTAEAVFTYGTMTILSLRDSYSQFTYDEDSNSYVAHNVEVIGEGGVGIIQVASLKFADGKIAFIELDDGESTIRYLIYDYGTTAVSLPSVAK